MKLDDMKDMAIKHAEKVAQLEVEALRKRLSDLYPCDMPITIQLFQPVEGGRLVDVGPRPKSCDDSLIYQPNNAGRTGDIFMDKQAPHRFIPKSEKIGEIATGTFTKAMLDLEQRRYPDIGTWETNGPPSNAMIHQLPLAPLPLDLQPRPSTGQYRFANLGAVYTISHKAKGESNNLEKMLILYGLRAGEIAQQVRYEAICRESENSLNEDGWDAGTTECRLSVSRHLPTESWDPSECDAKKIDKEWKKNIDGGLCLLVGSLLLHHHWWFPYDPVAYQVLCRLKGEDNLAKGVYYQHLSSPPECPYITAETSSRKTEQLVAILCEDIAYIVQSFRGSGSPTNSAQVNRIHSAVLAMLIQFAGVTMRQYCQGVRDGNRLSPQKLRKSCEVQFLGVAPALEDSVKSLLNQAKIYSPIIKSSVLKKPDRASCEFVCSLLAPDTPPLSRTNLNTVKTHGLVCVNDANGYLLKSDRNGDSRHYLYWHTRAMLTLGMNDLAASGGESDPEEIEG